MRLYRHHGERDPAGVGHLVVGQGCDHPPAGEPVPGCGMYDLGAFVAALPGRLWQLATAGWSGLLLVAVVVTVLVVAVRLLHRWWWRRAVAEGFWVRITPPRTVDVGRAGAGWRLLVGLARLCRRGWHLARPPLAFEFVHTGDSLTVGLWLPGWVPMAAVTGEVERVWPGARVERTTPPTLRGAGGDGRAVAGYRLVASQTDLGPLVDDTRLAGGPARGVATAGDVLAPVLAALGRPGGPAMVQVLVRPATSRRVGELARAARSPAKPRVSLGVRLARGVLNLLFGLVRLAGSALFELITPTRTGPATGRRNSSYNLDRYRPVGLDPLEREAMRAAAVKLAAGPHVLATIRTGAARPDRVYAKAAARSVADGFATVARHLRPARTWRAGPVLERRWARRDEWLLLTTDELAVLAHLPADPARYGLATAALHRPPPTGARRVAPERSSTTAAGWGRTGWSTPPASAGPEVPVRLRRRPVPGRSGPRGRTEFDPYDNDHDYDAGRDEDDGWPRPEAA